MRARSGALGVLLTILGVALGAAPATAAVSPSREARAGGIGIRLLDVPTNALNDPRARAYIVDAVQPGATITRRVVVSNTTAATQAITLYAGGAAIVQDHFVPAAPDELSGWTQVAPGTVSLSPGSSQTATVTITVPADATNGERYATVWAKVTVPASASQPVAQVEQVGVRIYLDVSHGMPRSDFRIDTVTGSPAPGGTTVISAAVTDTGQRAMDLSGSVSLTSADGTIHAGPYSQDSVLTLAPGGSGTPTFTVKQALPPGAWKADLTLRSGTISHTVSGHITIGAASSMSIASGGGRFSRTTLLAGGGALTVLALGGVLYRSRYLSRRRHGKVIHD